MRLSGPISILLAVLLSLSSPANAAQPARDPTWVVLGMSQEPDTLNPLFAEVAASLSVMATIFTVDVQRNSAWEAFAQGVESLPNVRDGTWKVDGERMVLTWQLKRRSWHDGHPVTCADYVFGHLVARNPRVPVVTRDATNRIANVLCPVGEGALTVAVTWNDRYAYANLSVTEYGALPRHILGPVYRANPSALRGGPFGTDPSGTRGDGPFRLVEWRKGASLTVEAVPNHPIFGTPGVRRIIWRFIGDSKTLANNMLSGAIDAISTIGMSFDEAIQLERQSAGRVRVFFEAGLIWEHLDFNLDNPVLQDIRVRRAIAHGIDRDLIAEQVFARKQPVSHTYLPPKHPGFTDLVPRYAYDPGAARRLLADAGFAPGPDGVLVNPSGRRLSLELVTTAGNRSREQTAQIIQRQLGGLGIQIKIQEVAVTEFLNELLDRRRFTALAMYASVMSPVTSCAGLYTSGAVPGQNNRWVGQNYPAYRDREMDQVCGAIDTELDGSRRLRLLQRSAVLFSRDLPALPLFVRVDVAAAKPDLEHFMPVQVGSTYETWNAHQWSWRR